MIATLEELSQVLFHLEGEGGDNCSIPDPANQSILNNEFISDSFLIPIWKGLSKYSVSKNLGVSSSWHHSGVLFVSWICLKLLLVTWNIQKSSASKPVRQVQFIDT